jgi:transposase
MEGKSMDYDIYCGIDVGKTSLHVTALEKPTGQCLFDSEVVYEEKAVGKVLRFLKQKGTTLVIVDQYGGFGASAVAFAHALGLDVAHISPKRFCDIAKCFGEDKTDRIDARIICETAMCMPRFISPVICRKEIIAQVKVLLSCREAVSNERVAALNRIHAFLQQVSPPIAALFSTGNWTLGDPFPLQVMAKFGGPAGLRQLGRGRAKKWASHIRYYSKTRSALIDALFDAIQNQDTTLVEGETIEELIRKTAQRVCYATEEKAALDKLIEEKLTSAHLLDAITSLPGIGAHFGAVIICEVGDIRRFASEAHLASYGGTAPVKRESGLKKGKGKRKGYNRRLKNCFIQAARRAVQSGDEASVAYFEKKRAEGKDKPAAYLALARRRVSVIYEILRHDATNISANSAS